MCNKRQAARQAIVQLLYGVSRVIWSRDNATNDATLPSQRDCKSPTLQGLCAPFCGQNRIILLHHSEKRSLPTDTYCITGH